MIVRVLPFTLNEDPYGTDKDVGLMDPPVPAVNETVYACVFLSKYAKTVLSAVTLVLLVTDQPPNE